MKALITGATGFLGSHIAERLVARGDDVRALVRPSSDTSHLRALGVALAIGDITDSASLREGATGVDVIYHTAATVTDWAPWSEFETVTVRGTRNVFQAAATAGVTRVLHVSTDGVYALKSLRKRVTEEAPLERHFGPLDYYRRSKLAAEKVARRYSKSGQVGVTIVRPGLLLGERDRAIFPGTVAFLRSGSAVYLGSGTNRLPYVYVGDVAHACILGATNDVALGRIYNVASNENVTQRDLFSAIAEAMEIPVPKRSVPVPALYAAAAAMETAAVFGGRKHRPQITRFGVLLLALDYREDTTRIRRELGWTSEVTLREAIRRTVEARRSKRAAAAGG